MAQLRVIASDHIGTAAKLIGIDSIVRKSDNAPIELMGSVAVWITPGPTSVPGAGLRCGVIPLVPDFQLTGRSERGAHKVWTLGVPRIECDPSEGQTFVKGGDAVLRISNKSLFSLETVLTIREPSGGSATRHYNRIAMWLLEVFKVYKDPDWRNRVEVAYAEAVAATPPDQFWREIRKWASRTSRN